MYIFNFFIYSFKNPFELILAFVVEMVIFLILMCHPSFSTLGGLILPSLSMLLNIISFISVSYINYNFKLKLNVNYISNITTIILNIIINTFIIKYINKKNKLIILSLTVINKIPINYDYSIILFEDNIGKKYFIKTDLDENFKLKHLYKVNLKNINISSKPINFHEEKIYEIKDIDASIFYCLTKE